MHSPFQGKEEKEETSREGGLQTKDKVKGRTNRRDWKGAHDRRSLTAGLEKV